MEQLSLVAFCRRCGAACPVPKKHGSLIKRTCDDCQKAANRERNRRYRERNPDVKRTEYERRKPAALAAAAAYAKANPEKRRAAVRAWRSRNPGVGNARRSQRLRGTGYVRLDAIDRAIVKALYAKRDATGLGSGLGPGYFNVDHIQPLAAGGEHAPWNLRVVPWELNQSKKDALPTLREVMQGERRYRLLRRIFENAMGAAAA
jgi:hypothetical protein